MSDSSEYEEEKVIRNKKTKKRHVEESDEEYDEEESRYAKRRKNIGNYILDEAAVDDDDEEDDDYEDENNLEDLIDNPDEVAMAEDAMQYVQYDNRARQNSLDLEDEEEIEEHYRQKYENDGNTEFGNGTAMANAITQQSCLPGVKDANIWQIKCFEGEEKNTVLKLMHKFKILQQKSDPMNILSVFSKDSVKGYIYMEAYKESHVKKAAEDIRSIAYGISNIKMISIPEMPEILKVLKAFKRLAKGQWVRLNKGLYRNDLAKVITVDEGQSSVVLQLLPRIDYKQLSNDNKTQKNIKQKFFVKPLPALFNRKKVLDLGLDISKNGKFFSFRRNDFDEQGFLYKEFKMNFILSHGVKPEMHEIERFNENINSVEVAKQMKKGLEGVDQTFDIGDQVIVISGALKDLKGKVVSIENKNVIIHALDLKQNMSFRTDELRRTFKVGDSVRVLCGQFEGETGIVVQNTPQFVAVLSNTNMHQFKVKPMDLVCSTAFSVETQVNNRFLVGDLIHIDPKTVGVILQFQKTKMKVLTNMNKEVMLESSSSFTKNNNKKSVTFDSQKQEIRVKDMVDVVSGICAGKQGEIRHIWKGFLFIYNNQFAESRGLLSTKGNTVVKRGSMMLGNSTNGQKSVPQSPRIHSNNNRNENRKPGGFKAPNSLKEEMKFIGSSVIINRGPLKGKIGIIKNIKLDAVSIELHSEFKTVNVSKENFVLIDSKGKKIESSFGTPSQKISSSSVFPSTTPNREAKTPMYGAQTPNLGSKTPIYGSDNSNKSRRNDGGRTPLCSSSFTPRTPYSGSETPRAGAFDPVIATPAYSYDKSPSYISTNRTNNNDEEEYGNWGSKNKTTSNNNDEEDEYGNWGSKNKTTSNNNDEEDEYGNWGLKNKTTTNNNDEEDEYGNWGSKNKTTSNNNDEEDEYGNWGSKNKTTSNNNDEEDEYGNWGLKNKTTTNNNDEEDEYGNWGSKNKTTTNNNDEEEGYGNWGSKNKSNANNNNRENGNWGYKNKANNNDEEEYGSWGKKINATSNTRNNNSDDEESFGDWGKSNNTPKSPEYNSQSSKNDAFYPSTPASPTNSIGNASKDVRMVPGRHCVKNAEVFVTDSGIRKVGIIQRQSYDMLTVRLTEDNQIVNVPMNSVFRKEPESGNNVIYVGKSSDMANNDYGKCLSTDKYEATVQFKFGGMKLVLLKDLMPYNTDDI